MPSSSVAERFLPNGARISANTKHEIIVTLVGFGLSVTAAYFILNQILKRLDPTNAEKIKAQEIVCIYIRYFAIYAIH